MVLNASVKAKRPKDTKVIHCSTVEKNVCSCVCQKAKPNSLKLVVTTSTEQYLHLSLITVDFSMFRQHFEV